MRSHRLEREQRIALSPADTFTFFSDAHNLERITPGWLRFRVVTAAPLELREGTLIEYRLRLHRVPIRWLTRIQTWEPGRRFVDLQVRGPYRFWHHTHTFTACDGGTLMRDVVRYALPCGPLGGLAHSAFVRRDLERIFDFRRDVIARALPAP